MMSGESTLISRKSRDTPGWQAIAGCRKSV
jgi:hypothetical protein